MSVRPPLSPPSPASSPFFFQIFVRIFLIEKSYNLFVIWTKIIVSVINELRHGARSDGKYRMKLLHHIYVVKSLVTFSGVKGDGKYANIAAASVLAKTHRDEYMERLAEEFPAYGWSKNKGYPTKEHRLAIRDHGLTPHHRLSFNSSPEQLELF